jgi:hypothetical protein
MMEKKILDPARMNVVIAILIALVSLTTALAAEITKNKADAWTGFILIS